MLSTDELTALAIEALQDIKAKDIRVLDLRGRSNFTDVMVIATGNTDRQVKALAHNVVAKAKERGVQPVGVEGERHGEWILVDLADVVVHIMQPAIRRFYDIEKLWGEESPVARLER